MESIDPVHCARSGRRYRRITWVISLIALPACLAAGARRQDQATLYFFNTSGWKAIPEKLTVLDNSEKILALNRQHYVVLSLAPGHHVLQPKQEHPPKGSPKHEVELDAKPGATYYVAGGYTPDLHNFVWTFAEVSKDEADRLLAQMKPVKTR